MGLPLGREQRPLFSVSKYHPNQKDDQGNESACAYDESPQAPQAAAPAIWSVMVRWWRRPTHRAAHWSSVRRPSIMRRPSRTSSCSYPSSMHSRHISISSGRVLFCIFTISISLFSKRLAYHFEVRPRSCGALHFLSILPLSHISPVNK